MPEEKRERGDDLVDAGLRRSGPGGREKTSSGAGVLSLCRSSMSQYCKGEKESGPVLRENRFSIFFEKYLFRKRSGL